MPRAHDSDFDPTGEMPPAQDDLPYYERAVLKAIRDRARQDLPWNTAELTRAWKGCGYHRVDGAVKNLTRWGYLKLWRESHGFGKGVFLRYWVFPNETADPEPPMSHSLPYFEEGLLDEIEEREQTPWKWNAGELTLPWKGCGRRGVDVGVHHLIDWGYLEVWYTSEEARRNRDIRHVHFKTYRNGDGPKAADTTKRAPQKRDPDNYNRTPIAGVRNAEIAEKRKRIRGAIRDLFTVGRDITFASIEVKSGASYTTLADTDVRDWIESAQAIVRDENNDNRAQQLDELLTSWEAAES